MGRQVNILLKAYTMPHNSMELNAEEKEQVINLLNRINDDG